MQNYQKLLTVSISAIVTAIGITSDAVAATIVPPGFTDSSVGAIPFGPSNAYGGVAADASGNVFSTNPFGNNGQSIVKFPFGGGITSFGGSGNSLSLALAGSNLFTGFGGGEIRKTDLNTNLTTTIGSIGGDALSMAFAPTGFGSFGGKLIIGSTGGMFAFDTTTNTSTQFGGGSYWEGVSFTPSGDLIASQYNTGVVSKITSGGAISTLFSVGGNIGAIAVRQDSGEIFVANENAGTIGKYSAAGTFMGTFASGISWDGGYWPSAMAFSQDGASLYYMETPSNDPAAGVRKISGFAAYESNSVPDSGTTVALLGGAFLSLAALRRRLVRA